VDDYRAISDLIVSYAALVDAGDFAGVGSLFASGSFVGSGAVFRGAAEVSGMLSDTVILYEDGTPRTKHVTTNISISVTGTTASSEAYVTVLQAVPGLALQPIAAGRYEDSFSLVDGTWAFTERRVTIDLVGDVSHHLRPWQD
jgi:hypothetical protein